MMAVSKILAGGAAIAALASAAPAAAQYYPGYGYGYGNGGNVIGQVLNQVLGGSQYGYGYGVNSQAAVQRCAAAVEQRINRDYGYGYGSGGYGGYGGYNGYGGYSGYGYASGAGNARVLAVTSVERRSNNGLRVRGVATANAYASGGYGSPYAGGYGGYGTYGGYAPQASGELTFKCNVDYRGYISNIDLDRNSYASYGYRRY